MNVPALKLLKSKIRKMLIFKSYHQSLEASKDKVSKIKTQDTRMLYCHPNYKSHCIIQQTNQRRNQYEKLKNDPIILKRSSSVESYYFPNQRSLLHTAMRKIELGN
jgi:hypothetical protein